MLGRQLRRLAACHGGGRQQQQQCRRASAVAAAAAAAAPTPPTRHRRDRATTTTTTTTTTITPRAAVHTHAVTFHEDFRINPIPAEHRFPMPKDAMLYDALVAEGLAGRTFTPAHADADTLALAHDREFVEAFLGGSIDAARMRRIGLNWSPELVRRTTAGVGSAVLAARLALQFGVAIMTNGGTHHAHPSHGSGWCIFNDLAVAARAAQRDAGVRRVLFIDLDVHHGDGTAAIFACDPTAFTFSMHCDAQTFPAERPPSDLDVGLPAGAGDDEYLALLRDALPEVLRRAGAPGPAAAPAAAPGAGAPAAPGAAGEPAPAGAAGAAAAAGGELDLVLYNAGVDVHADDDLGLLRLSDAGIARRDALVLDACAAAGVPVAAAIGGGYAKDRAAIVRRHLLLHRAAAAAAPRFAAMADARRAAARRSTAGGGGGGSSTSKVLK